MEIKLHKWEKIPYSIPQFPLVNDRIFKDDIVNYWHGKPVRFAELNNCVGCFHRSPVLLRKMFEVHPNKMEWFKNQEGGMREKGTNGCWRSDMSYEQIQN